MESDQQQLCIACNKMNPTEILTCDCGHVLKKSTRKESSRKRKPTCRPDSVNLECFDITFDDDFERKKEKKIKFERNKNLKEGAASKKKRRCKIQNQQILIKLNKTDNPGEHLGKKQEMQTATSSQNNLSTNVLQSKQEEIKKMLHLIETSYKNIYFHRCRSYKKLKLSDFDFEFDFSTFETHCPHYPSALEDINAKIARANLFKRTIEKV